MRRTVSAGLVACLTFAVFGAGTASATDTGQVTQVTSGNNKSTVPVMSASGNEVVFHSSATDIPGAPQTNPSIDDVYVADSSSSPFSFVAYSDGDTGERASFPDISANGRWIVFTRVPPLGAISEVVRVDLADGSEVSIIGNDDSGELGRNVPGARVDNTGNVVFSSLASDLTGSPDADAADGQVDIYWWTGTGNATKISDDTTSTDFFNPDISATNGIIVYNSDDGAGDKDVFSNDSTGGAQVNLTSAGNGQHDSPKLVDDGTAVSFRSDSNNLDGGNNTPNVFAIVAGNIIRVTNHTTTVTNPVISADGNFVAYQMGGEIHRSAVADGSTIQISDNIAPGPIDYAAINGDGTRIAFAMSTDGTVAGVQIHLWEADPVAPAAPTAVTAALTNDTTAEVTFTAPNDNGSPISGYVVTSSPGGLQGTGSASPILVAGLLPDTTYTFTVEAMNAAGNGPASAASNAVTTPDPCGPILSSTYQGMSGTDGRIARLYAAYFLRSPDTGGFQFWQARIAAGDWTNDDAATFFSESAEFEALYGTGLSNSAFIDLLYENVLCRTADAGGKAFWLNLMNNEGWSRGQVALGFSDSAEFKTRTATS